MYPLEDIDVIEFSKFVAGPNCGQWLASLGANVVKLEPPEGEPARNYAFQQYSSYNLGGKRSLSVDLKTEEGREVLRELAGKADVILQNFGPGTVERFGLDYETVSEYNEDIVYCSISAFGEEGPYSGYPGIDHLMQPMSGLMAYVGLPAGLPNITDDMGYLFGTNLMIDNATGIIGALLISSALRRRDHTGEGEFLDVALYDTALQFMGTWIAEYTSGEEIRRRTDVDEEPPSRPAPFGLFDADGGELFVAAINEPMFERFCAVLDREDWLEDERFGTRTGRQEHNDELSEAIQEELAGRDRDELFHTLAEAGVVAGPYQDVTEAVDSDPHVEARGMLTDTVDPRDGSSIRTATVPSRSNQGGPRTDAPPPRAGENNREILAELGYSEAEIDELAAAGVLSTVEFEDIDYPG